MKLTLLAIDDGRDHLAALRAVMEDVWPGSALLTAEGGAAGISVAINSDPDVILLDRSLRDMDSLDLCRRLKEDPRTSDIPIMFLSPAQTDRTWKKRALEAGADGFVHQPIDDQELVAQVRAMARLKQIQKNQLAGHPAGLESPPAGRGLDDVELLNLRMAVEQSANTVVITDPSGAIEYVNPAFEHITGYSAAEVAGQNPRVLKSGEHPADHYRQLWLTISSGKTWRGEFHNRRKDGSLYWESATISPVFDSAGRIARFIAVKEDITQKKDNEDKIRELHRRLARIEQEEKRHLAASLHDCTVQDLVALQLNLARAEKMLTDAPGDLLNVLEDCAALAGQCAGELRSLAYDLHAPWLSSGGLPVGVREYARKFQTRTGILVHLDMPDSLPRLQDAQELALYRIMQESLLNTHKHSGAKTSWIKVAVEDGSLCLLIRDDGMQKDLSNSFPPGIGTLSMQERMVAAGGRLEIQKSSGNIAVRAVVPIAGDVAGKAPLRESAPFRFD